MNSQLGQSKPGSFDLSKLILDRTFISSSNFVHLFILLQALLLLSPLLLLNPFMLHSSRCFSFIIKSYTVQCY